MSAVLTIDQIQYIDRYLKHADVQYVDVRTEMIDHVALGVSERMINKKTSFYDAFKWYMVAHKKELLNNYEKLKKKNQSNGYKLLWPWLKKPFMMMLFLGILVGIQNFNLVFGFKFPYSKTVWSMLAAMAIIYFAGTYPLRNNRYSGIEALAWFIVLFNYILLFLFNLALKEQLFYNSAPYLLNAITALMICVFLAWGCSFFEQRREFKRKYQIV